MKKILLISLILLVSACISTQTEECDDCKVPTPSTTLKVGVCGNGQLEGFEQCEVGKGCDTGFCRHCMCENITEEDKVADCDSFCRTFGTTNNSVVEDGQCNPFWGDELPCKVKCSYYQVFPSIEEGKVCCCRQINYINCPTQPFEEECGCPTRAEASKICAQYSPKPIKNSGED